MSHMNSLASTMWLRALYAYNDDFSNDNVANNDADNDYDAAQWH